MRIPLQLRINNTIVDLYNDESIVLKQLIKDLRDPKSLFTDFSRSFTVPASKTNNKLFKHWYNVNIVDGIDIREFLDAEILLNGDLFKAGNISVESVDMTNGVAKSYKLRFYGNLTEIAKNIGQDELRGLDLISHDITPFDPETEFEDSTERDVVFPLSSRNDRFIVDTDKTGGGPFDNVSNIWYIDSTHQDYYGLNESNIVGAIKVGALLDAIEDKYGFTFTGVLTQDYIKKLYMWLHVVEKEGNSGLLDLTPATSITLKSGYGSLFGVTNNSTNLYVNYDRNDYRIQARIKGTSSATSWKAELRENGNVKKTVEDNGVWSTYETLSDPSTVTIYAQTNSSDTVDIEVEFLLQEKAYFSTAWVNLANTIYEDTISVGSANYFSVVDNMPKMKILDFLGSLFNMFNIVAEVDENLNVTTKHYDVFMSEGTTKDISDYVDTSSYSIGRGNLYSSMRFEFDEAKTVMEEGYKKVNGKKYGEVSYELRGQNGNRLIGQEYKVKIKNQRIPLEPLFDGSGNGYRGIVYAQFSDKKAAEQQTSPMFTYVWGWSGSGRDLAWNDGSTISQITQYVMPSNVFSNHTEPTTTNTSIGVGLHFSPEINEQLTTKAYDGSDLLNLFYTGLLGVMFNQNTRNVSFSAYIPLSVFKDLKLSDVLKINNEYYRLNGIETNFLTGESKLDLTLVGITDLPAFNVLNQTIENNTGSGQTYRYIDTDGYVASGYLANGGSIVVESIGGFRGSSELESTDIDLSLVETLTLGYGGSDTIACAMGTTGTFYSISDDPIVDGAGLYTDSGLTTFASANVYSDGTNSRYWSGTVWSGSATTCAPPVYSLAYRTSISSTNVCASITGTQYSSSANAITDGTAIYTSSSLTVLSAANWYSDGTWKREWDGSAWLGSAVSC